MSISIKGVPRKDILPRKYKGPRPMRDLRLRMKMTQARAAELLDVTVGTYQVWESGRGIPPRYWQEILINNGSWKLWRCHRKNCSECRGVKHGAA